MQVVNMLCVSISEILECLLVMSRDPNFSSSLLVLCIEGLYISYGEHGGQRGISGTAFYRSLHIHLYALACPFHHFSSNNRLFHETQLSVCDCHCYEILMALAFKLIAD